MSPSYMIGPTIIAIGIVTAAVAFVVVGTLLETADGAAELRIQRAEAELEAGRAEIARLDGQIRELRMELDRLRDEMALLPSQSAAALPQAFGQPQDEQVGDHQETEAPTEVMMIADAHFNEGIRQPRNSTMIEILGHPRDSYSSSCQPVTNARLNALLETRDFGRFRATMIRPALDSLERIMARLRETEPDIEAAIGTAGALCARLVRGSRSSISNHSWGTAIDITLRDVLDRFADGGTQFGLLLLAEAFNEEGWFWGATYSREDSMHFEVGEETLRAWFEAGQL